MGPAGAARRTTLAAALLLASAGCTGADEGPEPSPTESSPASGAAEPSSEARDLEWRPTGESPEARFIQGDGWSATVDPSGSSVTFDGPGQVVVRASGGRQVDEVLMEGEAAVVVAEHPGARRPAVATLVDLDDGTTSMLADPPPSSYGGAFALHDGRVYYGTDLTGPFCLADVDATSGEGGVTAFCAEADHGVGGITATPSGVTLMTFDDRRPVSCRTLGWLTDAGFEPLPHVTECLGWDVAATSTGVVWSEVPRPRRQDSAEFFAIRDGDVVELGPGATGSLTACGTDVYFVRDSRGRTPAQLVRWTAAGEQQVAYEAKGGGQSFLGEPACADDVLTVSAFSEGGDEQVWADTDVG